MIRGGGLLGFFFRRTGKEATLMSALYIATAQESITCSEPLGTAYQMQSRAAGRVPKARRPEITAPMRLLIGSVVQLGRRRPHGAITWLADVFRTSRQTIYDVGQAATVGGPSTEAPAAQPRPDRVALERAALSLLVVGGMCLRPTAHCLAAPLGRERSAGWLAGLVDQAGAQAGKVLEAADWSAARPMIAARDELYFGEHAWLLTVATRSLTDISGHVETGVEAGMLQAGQ